MNSKWTFLGAALLVCGCTNDKQSGVDTTIKLNSSPSHSNIVNIDFKNHPGPLSEVEAIAHYKVGDGCTPPQPLSGAVLPPEHSLPLAVKRVHGDSYQATFYLDALHNDDYFGLGICHWALQNLTVTFKSPATQFLASFSNSTDSILSNTEQVNHYLVADYFKKPSIGNVVFGERKSFYLPKLGRQFQVVLSAKKSESGAHK
jgi:hypothetical protein